MFADLIGKLLHQLSGEFGIASFTGRDGGRTQIVQLLRCLVRLQGGDALENQSLEAGIRDSIRGLPCHGDSLVMLALLDESFHTFELHHGDLRLDCLHRLGIAA